MNYCNIFSVLFRLTINLLRFSPQRPVNGPEEFIGIGISAELDPAKEIKLDSVTTSLFK